MPVKKIIYDFGSNNGDDIPYYLLRADLVIAVEANPDLCTEITNRFQKEIDQRRLIVENYVLTDSPDHQRVPFFIHKTEHGLSQFPEPRAEQIDQFTRVNLPCISPVELIQKHGTPHYIKIDIEHYDIHVLRCLFSHDVFPSYISAEAHDLDVLSVMIEEGGYRAFKFVDCSSISEKYRNLPLTQPDGSVTDYSFLKKSAGPYGNDIHGDWFSGEYMMKLLTFYKIEWKDVHASRNDTAVSRRFSSTGEKVKNRLLKIRRRIRRKARHILKSRQ